jgi:hypothetical protein
MGGPWIGTLVIDNVHISDNIIIDNYLEKNDIYYFIKYFEVSKKQKDNYFSIFRINMTNLNFELSNERFEKVYIENIEDNILFYYNGFHANLPIETTYITFNSDNL